MQRAPSGTRTWGSGGSRGGELMLFGAISLETRQRVGDGDDGRVEADRGSPLRSQVMMDEEREAGEHVQEDMLGGKQGGSWQDPGET
eukprot:365957-Chlamydomonas_euryale.AAC.6